GRGARRPEHRRQDRQDRQEGPRRRRRRRVRPPMERENTATGTVVVPIRNLANETVGEASLPEEIFGVPFRRHLVWEVVKGIRAREHRGTHKTKTRSEVSGTGKKPFKQKHTGRARQGGGRPPIHRGGGTVHGPVPRSSAQGPSAGGKKNALKAVLSQRAREERLGALDRLA